jgi:hypothetical protein
MLADLFVEAAPGTALLVGLTALITLALLILGFFYVLRE